jgi:CheY-like chemotaxis protein
MNKLLAENEVASQTNISFSADVSADAIKLVPHPLSSCGDSPTFNESRSLEPELSVNSLVAESENSISEQSRFLFDYGQIAHSTRRIFATLANAKDSAERLSCAGAFSTQIRSLGVTAAENGVMALARLCAPLEAVAARIIDAPPETALAILRKVANTVDLLVSLSRHTDEIEPLSRIEPRVLVVDDEDVSREAIMLSLQKVQMNPVGSADSTSALSEAAATIFDLILLDVEMPGINGFGLCARIRLLPCQKTTPVIFVSALQDLKSRASSLVSGGNHFINSPIDFDELTLTVLTFVIKCRIRDVLRGQGDASWVEFR